jgi:hypothetical protein
MEFNPLHNIPDILYKYRDWNDKYHKRLLTHNEIYFSAPSQFNDPFDAALPFRYIDEELTNENIYKKLYELGKYRNPGMLEEELNSRIVKRMNSGEFDDGTYWKKFHSRFIEMVNEAWGICSLTKKNDNILMWSHYSNSHKGFCVGLDKFKLFEHSGVVSPVIYSNDFPKISLLENEITSIHRLITTKSLHWEYEQEFRLRRIASLGRTVVLPDEAFKELILGFKMDDRTKEEIKNIAKTKFPNMKLFQSLVDDTQFKLNIVPLEK